jgi:hypothetical protein
MTQEQKVKIIGSLREDALQIGRDIEQLCLNLNALNGELEYYASELERRAHDQIDSADDSADEAYHYLELSTQALATALEQFEED